MGALQLLGNGASEEGSGALLVAPLFLEFLDQAVGQPLDVAREVVLLGADSSRGIVLSGLLQVCDYCEGREGFRPGQKPCVALDVVE